MAYNEFVALFQQRASEAGYYTLRVDGHDGPGTRKALDQVLPPMIVLPKPEPLDNIPDSGDKKLAGVHKDLISVIRLASLNTAIPFTVTEGLRSKERQAKLVKAGASKTTNSRHLTGHAVDLWPLKPDGKPYPSPDAFKPGSAEARHASAELWAGLRQVATAVKAAAKELGVMMEHGVDWGWDAPHHQLNRKAYPA